MSPTQVYRIFESLFPDWNMKSYIGSKTDKNAIILTDEWGCQYFFKHTHETKWIFETYQQYLSDTGRS